MTDGKMTAQDRSRLRQWQETDAALDETEHGAAWQAMYRAEALQLDPIAHALAGEAADAQEQGMTEEAFWATPNAALQHTLRAMHISPVAASGQLAVATATLKAHGLWPWT